VTVRALRLGFTVMPGFTFVQGFTFVRGFTFVPARLWPAVPLVRGLVVCVELVGDVLLGFHQVLLEFLFGVPAAPGGIPQFPGGLGSARIKVGGPGPAGLLGGGYVRTPFFGASSFGVRGSLAIVRRRWP
jgi:hypothetical protein